MSAIFEELAACVMAGNVGDAAGLVRRALDEGHSPKVILDNGLVVGMDEVGRRFKRAEMFVPEVLMSAKAMHQGLEVLRPMLAASGEKLVGKVVLGTVKGDLHDIGKNLVGMMCEGAGFEVIDLGFNVENDAFIKAVKEHKPEVVGMSALLTTTMRSMAQVVKGLEEAGLRDTVKIMVGGAPVDADFAQRIGADGYGSNAVSGAQTAKEFVGAA